MEVRFAEVFYFDKLMGENDTMEDRYENRDFKGVWIPKEIWLNDDLSAIEKHILTEIDSLDNENHCTASNDYLAGFCKCGVATISRAIKHLKELGLIETSMMKGTSGSYRVIKVSEGGLIKLSRGGRINMIRRVESNRGPINIINNNINNLSKDKLTKTQTQEQDNFKLGTQKKVSKPNMYNQCINQINGYTTNPDLIKALTDYLQVRLQNKEKPLYSANMWKGLLNKLDREFKTDGEKLDTVYQSIERGYASFFPVNTNNIAGYNKIPSTNKYTNLEGIPQDDRYDNEDHRLAEEIF